MLTEGLPYSAGPFVTMGTFHFVNFHGDTEWKDTKS